jgi:hypothetical protein
MPEEESTRMLVMPLLPSAALGSCTSSVHNAGNSRPLWQSGQLR